MQDGGAGSKPVGWLVQHNCYDEDADSVLADMKASERAANRPRDSAAAANALKARQQLNRDEARAVREREHIDREADRRESASERQGDSLQRVFQSQRDSINRADTAPHR